MLKKVLVSNLMMLKEKARFENVLRLRGIEPIFPEVDQHLTREQCLYFAGKIDGWLAGDDPVDEYILRKMFPRLKIISKWGTGIDSFDITAANKIGIKITNTPQAFDEAVGEIAVGYVLALTREIVLTHLAVCSGEWPKKQHKSLSQLKIGLLGFGAIGKGIAKRLSCFTANVSYYDPIQVPDRDLTATPVSLSELNVNSDVVILCCSMTETNRNLINDTFLQKMKKGSFVVNVSRGGLIDEIALAKHLQEGHIAGAALDVYRMEPVPSDSELRKLNVILGSHNANNTEKAVEFVHQNTLKNLFDAMGV